MSPRRAVPVPPDRPTSSPLRRTSEARPPGAVISLGVTFFVTAGAVFVAATLARPAAAQTARPTAFTGATLWDGTGAPAIPGATLVVDGDGRIMAVGADVSVPANARVVDLSGRYVIPGLINAHGHVTGRWAPDDATPRLQEVAGDLRLYARYGVTTVNSLGDGPEVLRARSLLDPAEGYARLLAAGEVITSTDPDDARTATLNRLEAGADWIKFRVDDNLGATEKMPPATREAIIETAHEGGGRVATHVFYLADAKNLLRAGTDLIAHSVRDTDVDPEFVRLLRERDVCYVPTLTREVSTFAYAERPAFFDDPFFQRWADEDEVARVSDPDFRARMAASPAAAAYREALEQAMENLQVLAGAGVAVAMGTDSGPPGRFPGYFEHLEVSMMVDAGLTPEEALRSATGVAAECLGLDAVGTLEPGHHADFLVLDADPLADISATRALEAVYVAGVEVR